jgi:protein-(glutamine-N5) methyltransferase, release factor-specific
MLHAIMTIREAKVNGIKKLRHASRREAPIDAEILLAHALNISREELLAHDERRVPSFALAKFNSLVARRGRHEPIAYLTGHKEFFGLQFAVNKHTLIPRPETELVVEEALATINTKNPTTLKLRGAGQEPNSASASLGKTISKKSIVIDVGTGSGAIAIAIAKNAPNATVIATDISKPALKIAERNAVMNDVDDRIIFEHANLLHPRIPRSWNSGMVVITANLPYLPTKVWQRSAPDVKKYEPKTALEGGKDGLKYYDELFHQIVERNIKATTICEIDPSQKRSFPRLAARHFPKAKIEIKNDLAGLPRVVIIKN